MIRRSVVFGSTIFAAAVLCAPVVAQEVAPGATQSETIQLAPPEVLAAAKTAFGVVCDFEFAAGPDERHQVWPIQYKPKGDEPDAAPVTLKLHQLFCYSGAYNVSYAYMIESEDYGFAAVQFAVPEFDPVYENPDDDTKVLRVDVAGFATQNVLANPTFDLATTTLKSNLAWRGIGDASSVGTWRFIEGKFVLTRFEIDASYDGDVNLSAIYDANAETP